MVAGASESVPIHRATRCWCTLASDGDPGVILVSDVGWNVREEISQVDAPGLNLGWPIFEGLTEQNLYAPHFHHRKSIRPQSPRRRKHALLKLLQLWRFVGARSSDPRPLPNPCDPSQTIPSTTPQFVHRRPIIDWVHGGNPVTRVPLYSPSGDAIFSRLGLPDAPVAGDPFLGKCHPGVAGTAVRTRPTPCWLVNWVHHSPSQNPVNSCRHVEGGGDAPVWGGTTNTNVDQLQTRLDRQWQHPPRGPSQRHRPLAPPP